LCRTRRARKDSGRAPDERTAAHLLRVTADEPEYLRQAAAQAAFWEQELRLVGDLLAAAGILRPGVAFVVYRKRWSQHDGLRPGALRAFVVDRG
jgi:hypothetical protein